MKEWLANLGKKFIKDFMHLHQGVEKVKGEKRYRQAYKYAALISVFLLINNMKILIGRVGDTLDWLMDFLLPLFLILLPKLYQ